ncbi:DUF1367 family protein [Pseudoalteromonas sp.]|uniref:DUF1367 family protein n=1 Tax=Pseudoalteromonas sp. TaxID=53249 RepID=UPI00257A86B0|nr:DUF1367 family protein [Pseudoalteromonas sp.]
MIKQPGGVFVPASDLEADKLTKFKTGEQYEIEIKLTRNAAFHRKVFAFFNFCFDHWKGDNEFQCEQKQFNVFRDHLTVLAGFCDELYNINGELRIEAKSISFGKMSQEEFELLYNALINSAIKHIFPNCDQNTIDQLYNFF